MMYSYSPFRATYEAATGKGCPLCATETMQQQTIRDHNGKMMENTHVRWVVNYYPKFEGHTMVVPKRHITNLEDETPDELVARDALIRLAARALRQAYPGAGIEIFLQTGRGSAASLPHLHWHVLPAQPDDHLRSFEKLGHFYTTEEGKEKVLLFPHPIHTAREDLQKLLSRTLITRA